MSNYDRALSVDDFVRQFAEERGPDLHPQADGPLTAGGDMICNLLHWLSQEIGIEPTVRCLQNAIGTFVVEYGSEDADCDGNADVGIHVTGWGGGLDGKRERFLLDVGPRRPFRVEGFVVARTAYTVTKGAS